MCCKKFIIEETANHWNTALKPRDVIKLIYANYRESQLTGYEILKKYSRTSEFTIPQIIALANHEILAIRQWAWNYFTANKERIRAERNNVLSILDTTWDDTRAFAFNFFKTQFKVTIILMVLMLSLFLGCKKKNTCNDVIQDDWELVE